MDKDLKFIVMILTTFFVTSMALYAYDMGMTHELERQKIVMGCK